MGFGNSKCLAEKVAPILPHRQPQALPRNFLFRKEMPGQWAGRWEATAASQGCKVGLLENNAKIEHELVMESFLNGSPHEGAGIAIRITLVQWEVKESKRAALPKDIANS